MIGMRMHSITVVKAAAWPKPPLSQMLQMTTVSVMFSARESKTARVGRKAYAIRPYDGHGMASSCRLSFRAQREILLVP